MRKTLIFAVVIAILHSCKPAAKILYGIKKPQLETHASIRDFVADHAIDTSRILYLKDLRSFASASQMKILSFPDAIFFNKDGKMVRYKKSSAQCNAAVGDFITDLKKLNSVQPEAVGLTEMSNLTDKKIIPADSITVLITFVKYAGKLNRTKAFEWVRLLEKAKADGVSVNYYLLSCDYQKNWNIPPALYKYLTYTGQRNKDFDIYKIPSGGGPEIQLTNTPGLDDGSEYSPDGKYIYFNSVRTGMMQLWRMKEDGTEQTQLTFDDYNNWFPHISPDGKTIVFLTFSKEVPAGDHPFYKHVYLRSIPITGGKPKVVAYLYGGQGSINTPSWSPDSKKIAFVSNTD